MPSLPMKLVLATLAEVDRVNDALALPPMGIPDVIELILEFETMVSKTVGGNGCRHY